MGGWWVTLNGVSLDGGGTPPVSGMTVVGCLTSPPDGLGVPGLRTEDVIYPQRDGARFFSDWYEPRIITAADVSVCPDDRCNTCPSARQKMAQLMGAWSRHCGDTELVIFTDCHNSSPAVTGSARVFIGPYGVAGRPRVAVSTWLRGRSGCGVATLRFDGLDQRLFILDPDGTPGSGVQCLDLDPVIAARCRTYPRCYPDGVMCYTEDSPSVTGVGPQQTDNFGTLCAPMSVTLVGPLSSPTVENITTGESFTYTGIIVAGSSVTVDTETGTAIDSDGISRTYLLEGDTRMQMAVGFNVLRLTSQGSSDSGTASVCYRPAVLSG